MTRNFWRDAHAAAMVSVAAALRPQWSKAFVGMESAAASSCAATTALHVYELQQNTSMTMFIGGALLAVVPAVYVSKLLEYPDNLSKRLTSDLRDMRERLRSKDVEESSIIALSEHLSEMKLLQEDRIRNPEQLAEWIERYQKLIPTVINSDTWPIGGS